MDKNVEPRPIEYLGDEDGAWYPFRLPGAKVRTVLHRGDVVLLLANFGGEPGEHYEHYVFRVVADTYTLYGKMYGVNPTWDMSFDREHVPEGLEAIPFTEARRNEG